MPNINPRIRSLDDLLGVAQGVENTAAAENKPAQPVNTGIQLSLIHIWLSSQYQGN